MLVQFWMVPWFLLVRQINSDYSVYFSASVWESRKTNSLPTVSKSLFWPSQMKLNYFFSFTTFFLLPYLFYYLLIIVGNWGRKRHLEVYSLKSQSDVDVVLCFYLFIIITTDASSDGWLFERSTVLCIFTFWKIFLLGFWWRWQLLNVCLNMYSSNMSFIKQIAAGINYLFY